MSNLAEIPTTNGMSKASTACTYSEKELAIVQSTVAKGTTTAELLYFIKVCESMKLNPFNKEVWCYKDKRGNLLIFAGRDGFLARAQKDPNFAGIRSCEVCDNDEFKMNIATGEIEHVPDFKNRGNIIGAYAIAFRKDGEPTIEWADFNVYNKGYNTWKTHPSEMIKKVAESHALKKAFGISGIQTEYDFSERNGRVSPIEQTTDSYEHLNGK